MCDYIDYNGDGNIDDYEKMIYRDDVCDAQEESYWDDAYFEEHRDDYSAGMFGSGRPSGVKTGGTKTENSSPASAVDRLVGLLVWMLFFVGACFLAVLGIGCMFVFPPLGIILLIPIYGMLGGR